jgi:hypothetical protein
MSAQRVLTDVTRIVKTLGALTIAFVILGSGWPVIDTTVMVSGVK